MQYDDIGEGGAKALADLLQTKQIATADFSVRHR